MRQLLVVPKPVTRIIYFVSIENTMPDFQSYTQMSRKAPLLKKRESLVYIAQVFIDLVLMSSLLLLLVYWKTGDIPPIYRILLVTAILLQFITYTVSGVYRRSGSFFQGCYRLAYSWIILLLLLVLIGFVTKVSEDFSREVFILWAVLGLAVQIMTYTAMHRAVGFLRSYLSEVTDSVIVGQGRLAEQLYHSINGNQWLPDSVVGFVLFNSEGKNDNLHREGVEFPVLGELANIKGVIREYNIKRIYIAIPLSQSGSVERLHVELLDMNVDLIWVPDIYALKLLNHSIREISGLPLIFLNESPMTSTRTGILIKALIDRVFALIALIVLSPVLAVIAVMIKMSSSGPVFFKQERHGWDGAVFKIWKFRSMYLHEEDSVKQAVKGDDRVTPIGAFIRRTSIDELPQLINVLLGEMSLVGPRPHAVAHNEYYDDHIEAYLLRHRIKPGITGLAQVNGCRGETDVVEKMRERVEYDLEYINNWSLWLDIKILLITPFTLFSKDIY